MIEPFVLSRGILGTVRFQIALEELWYGLQVPINYNLEKALGCDTELPQK
jgi:hypothetical protein